MNVFNTRILLDAFLFYGLQTLNESFFALSLNISVGYGNLLIKRRCKTLLYM